MDKLDEIKSKLCLQCMECCRYIGIVSVVNTPNERNFYETRGFTVIDNAGFLVIIQQAICPHLKWNGCDIYETRPAYCRNYDGRKDPFMKNKCLWRIL